MTEIRPNTPILDRINSPEDMKNLSDAQLYQLAKELRSETISIVSETGGHLGAGLGVVELTTAIHAVFDTPKDRLIWDVSHQCYPHKILTGRRNQMRTIRKGGGYLALPSDKKVPLIHLVLHIVQLQFKQLWGLLLLVI